LQRWPRYAQISERRVFRRIDRHRNLGPALLASTTGEIVKHGAEDVGLESDFGGNSLRLGLATSAARAGKTEASIMRRAVAQRAGGAALRSRAGQRWDDNAAWRLL
jgi:hypothetical protein